MHDHREQEEKPVGSHCLTSGQKWPFYGACLAVLALMSAMSYRHVETLGHKISEESNISQTFNSHSCVMQYQCTKNPRAQ